MDKEMMFHLAKVIFSRLTMDPNRSFAADYVFKTYREYEGLFRRENGKDWRAYLRENPYMTSIEKDFRNSEGSMITIVGVETQRIAHLGRNWYVAGHLYVSDKSFEVFNPEELEGLEKTIDEASNIRSFRKRDKIIREAGYVRITHRPVRLVE